MDLSWIENYNSAQEMGSSSMYFAYVHVSVG